MILFNIFDVSVLPLSFAVGIVKELYPRSDLDIGCENHWIRL